MNRKNKVIIGVISGIIIIVVIATLIPIIIIVNRDEYEWDELEYNYDDYVVNSEDYFVITIEAFEYDGMSLWVSLGVSGGVVDVYLLDIDNYLLFSIELPFSSLNSMDDITGCGRGFGAYEGGNVYYFIIDNKNPTTIAFDLDLRITFKTIIIY